MTSTELAHVEDGALADRMAYAKALAASDLLPAQYRNKPANVLVAVEYGRAVGVDPIVAIQQVHVIEGKPTASASLVATLVRRAGHQLRVQATDKTARATIRRADDPDFEFSSVWTIERAQKAGLLNKGVWKSYPESMLKARAITEVARDACPEVLAGVAYTAEELEGTGTTVSTSHLAARLAPVETPVVAVDVETGEIVDADVVGEETFPVGDPQGELL